MLQKSNSFQLITIAFLILAGCTDKKAEVRIPSVVPKRTDWSNLSFEAKGYLQEYRHRRMFFDRYLKANKVKISTCPGCGYPTLDARGEHEVCIVCGWEDTNQDDDHASENFGKPNKKSLVENRIAIGYRLHAEANQTGSFPRENAREVIEILGRYKLRITEIARTIPVNADTSYHARKELKKEKAALIEALFKND